MPIPLLFIGIAAITSATGIGSTIKAGIDQSHTKTINSNSEKRIENAATRLDELRKQCGTALETLGKEKVFILNGSISSFLNTFTKIKNVDCSDSVGLYELYKLHIDQKSFEETAQSGNFISTIATGSVAGAAGGTLAAFGAYSAATTFATASTGTAISALSGAAASNATIAFFGGGSMAVGGMGIAGGTAILGGLVAGPALLVMGIITGAKAGKSFEKAKAYAAEADVICEQLESGAAQCIAIRRRTYMFYNLLARLDAYFMPLIYAMEDIVKTEGTNYSLYSENSKKIIAGVVSVSVTIKAVLDTPILSEDGSLTEESNIVFGEVIKKINSQEES